MKALYKALAYAALAGCAFAIAAPANAYCNAQGYCILVIFEDGSFAL